MLEEMAANVTKEFDFAREALLMRVIGARLATSGVRGVGGLQPSVSASRVFGALRCSRCHLAQMLEEMAANVPKEFDFAREALLMRVIGARLAASGVRGVAVPEPLPALSSRALLVMQRMPGGFTRVLVSPEQAHRSSSLGYTNLGGWVAVRDAGLFQCVWAGC